MTTTQMEFVTNSKFLDAQTLKRVTILVQLLMTMVHVITLLVRVVLQFLLVTTLLVLQLTMDLVNSYLV